ncbi:MAG: hypothetical protein RBT70_09900 [Alphaproteobacteria bacterium]|jgi:hypothetical protein|nr:hypothetical protein [Alphaproteobacteria bacterium]
MKLFWKGIALVLFYVISGALLIYAASRSLDFITATLPADQQIIGYLGLAATSGGMIAWLMIFMYKAEGIGQKLTAGIMTALDMLGEFALFTMDTLYHAGESGMTAQLTQDEIRNVVLGLSALIAINILATIIFHLLDPENIKRMRESFVRDRLESDALKEIEKRGEEIAQRLAPQIAEQWAAEFEARFADMRSLGLGKTDQTPTGTAPVAGKLRPTSNHQESEAAELQAVPLPGFSDNGHR